MNESKFKTMTREELKQYILTHRDDEEALGELLDRPYPANSILFPADMPMEEAHQVIMNNLHKTRQDDLPGI